MTTSGKLSELYQLQCINYLHISPMQDHKGCVGYMLLGNYTGEAYWSEYK